MNQATMNQATMNQTTMNQNTKSILYYSKYCQQCKKLFLSLKEKKLFPIFNQLICVDNEDNTGVDDKIPKHVTCVPFIVTDDYDNPLINDIIFKWIDYKYLEFNNKKTGNLQQTIPSDTYKSKSPYIYGTSDNNENGKKETIKNFETLQELRANDDRKFNNGQNIHLRN